MSSKEYPIDSQSTQVVKDDGQWSPVNTVILPISCDEGPNQHDGGLISTMGDPATWSGRRARVSSMAMSNAAICARAPPVKEIKSALI